MKQFKRLYVHAGKNKKISHKEKKKKKKKKKKQEERQTSLEFTFFVQRWVNA